MNDGLSSSLVVLHGAWRWIVLATAIVCVARSLRGIFQHRLWTIADRRWAVAFVGTLDLQLTLGLMLFVKFGAPASYAAHSVSMIGAVAIAHWGNITVKRASPDVAPRLAARFFGCALVVIVAAIPWSRPLLTF